MKHMAGVIFFALTASSAFSQGYTEVDRGPHHRTWQNVAEVPGPDGRKRFETNSFVELQTGLHRRTERGWEVSDPRIEIINNGAQGAVRNLPYSVTFAGNLNTDGAIDLTLPAGERVTGHILGLAFTEGDRSVMIAEIKDCAGVVVGDAQNELTFIDAFTDFVIDVQFVVRPDGLSQNIILKQQLPSPTQWGLTEDAVLEVLTEFTAFPPVYKELRGTVQGLRSEYVRLGSMEFVTGKAFSLDHRDRSVPMRKSWEVFEGNRTVLLEKVPWREVAPDLGALPPVARTWRKRSDPVVMANNRRLPDRRETLAMITPLRNELTPVARASGYVLDFELVSSTNNFRWTNNTTYYVSGPFNVKTNVFEGGVVIKFAPTNGAKLTVTGPATWLSDIWNPVVMTARDDAAVGEAIGGGPLTGLYADSALVLDYNASGVIYDLHDLRIKHADTGVNVYFGRGHTLRNVQVIQCDKAINGHSSSYNLFNGLISRANTALHASTMSGVTGNVQNVTFSQCNNLSSYGLYTVTNGLLLGVTNVAAFTGAFNGTNSDHTAALQTVGAGGAYLQSSSPFRDVGTTGIDSSLLNSLKQLTTYPPLVFSNVAISAQTTLIPQAQRDTDVPDLGFHYTPLDYAFGGVDGNENITFAAGTAVGWFRTTWGFTHQGHGLHMADRKIVTFDGRADAPTYWIRTATVQEGSTGLWDGGYGTGGITGWASQTGSVTNSPEIRARFTRFSMLAGDGNHFRDDNGYLIARATDCEFWGGGIGTYVLSLFLTNCLLDRVVVVQAAGLPGNEVHLRNCTFNGGQLTFNRYYTTPAMPVSIYDSVFDRTTIGNDSYGNTTYSSNGYITNSAGQRLTPLAGNDVVTNNFAWQTSIFGRFYQAANSLFLDRGSTTANLVGLYHFTVLQSNIKETNSTVDLGYHYPAVPKVAFVGIDTTTLGNWKRVYGSEGYNVIQDVSAYPSYATVLPSANKAETTWNSAPTETRALQRAASGRIAACWYAPVGYFEFALTLNDGRPHRLAIYCLDWDSTARSETIDIRDSVTGAVYDSRSVSSFNPGKYYVWDILGDVTVRVTDNAAINAVISGLFFGPTSLGLADGDGDGVPDYLEDANGNGSVNSGETSWTNPTDPGLKVLITRPKSGSTVP